jgi:predicted nucleic acid-binding protein
VVLVDTSAWIAFFRRARPLDLEAHVDLHDVVTCLPVVQEVLQGIREERAYRTARDALLSFAVVDSPLEQAVFDHAVDLYRSARRQGYTVRSLVDCLIAASALRHDLEILHDDRDYGALARIAPLRQRSVRG